MTLQSKSKITCITRLVLTSMLLIVASVSAAAQTNTFPGSGNAGIGTTSPPQPLTVTGFAPNTYGNTTQIVGTAGSGTLQNQLNITSAMNTWGLILGQNNSGVSATGYHCANCAHVVNVNNAPLVFGTNNLDRMRIDQFGQVGIGTGAPTNLLHINSGAFPSSQFRISANSAGSLSGLAHTPDNAALGFDVDWNTGVGWIARHSTLATLYKLGGKLKVLGWTGATVGSPIPDWTVHTSLDLTTGKFGIGTDNPGYKLDVQGGQINASGGLCIAGDCKTAWSQVGGGGSSQWSGTSGNPIHYNGGNVGIGTDTPSSLLHLNVTSGEVIQRLSNAGGIGGYLDLRYRYESSQHRIGFTDGGGNWLFYTQYANPNTSATAYFPGNVTVNGSINAKYQDLAEWVPSSEQLSAGTVVILDTTKSNQVIASAVGYDTRVAGVISAQPGITLGESGEGKVLVATTGRVRVKVDASRGPIQIGDLLVTSDVPGVAMKSEAVEFAGRKMHMPGTIIGKALEPLAKGSGEILVLLSLQ